MQEEPKYESREQIRKIHVITESKKFQVYEQPTKIVNNLWALIDSQSYKSKLIAYRYTKIINDNN